MNTAKNIPSISFNLRRGDVFVGQHGHVVGLLRQTSTEDHAIRDYHLILRGIGEPSS